MSRLPVSHLPSSFFHLARTSEADWEVVEELGPWVPRIRAVEGGGQAHFSFGVAGLALPDVEAGWAAQAGVGAAALGPHEDAGARVGGHGELHAVDRPEHLERLTQVGPHKQLVGGGSYSRADEEAREGRERAAVRYRLDGAGLPRVLRLRALI